MFLKNQERLRTDNLTYFAARNFRNVSENFVTVF